jgi:ferredoxin-NADP reductase
VRINHRSPIVASQVSGDFVLPKDPKQKLAFIAGGIGVTPYRSMVKYLLDTNGKRTITMLYSARTAKDFAYQDVFEEARGKLDLNMIYVITNEVISPSSNIRIGQINAEMIKKEVSDYRQRLFYISGTHAMVVAIQAMLASLGVPKHQIKVDYFSGYA